MTKEELIEIAEQVYGKCDWHGDALNHLEQLAKLLAEHEREACAKLCDLTMLQNQEAINELEDDEHIAKCFIQGAMTQLVKTSKAIRARGQK
jgi:ABC-type dipeptide/oligopeptide/nickel transport system ATPase subunit